jgi:hypothetical protein
MEENEPKQRRPRTSNPAFSTPDQPTPQTKPAKAPPAVTFRPPAAEKPSSGTGSGSPTAEPSTQPRQNPAKSTPRRPAPPSRSRAQAAAKSQPARVEAAADAPPPGDASQPSAKPASQPPAKSQPQPAKATPAKAQHQPPAKAAPTPAKAAPVKAASAVDATPTKATPAKRQPRKATSPTKAAPTKETTPAKASPTPAPSKAAAAQPPLKAAQREAGPPKPAPAKKAAATLKAAAAELAPAVVKPDMTTVPDEQPATQPPAQPATPESSTPSPGNAPSADTELMPVDTTDLAAVVQEKRSTSPAAEPPATAPGQPGAAVPAGPTLPRGAASVADTLSGVRTEAWAALIADPGHSPELLAVAATQTIGPRAKEWARRTRAAYPGATPDALARLAAEQFTRFGSVSSVFAAVAGSYAPVALLGAAAFTHAELALHVAAAYGLDPTDRERAADLLVLTRVHPLREDAEAALAAAEQHSYEHTGLTDATWRLGRKVAVQAGGWVVVRAVNHFFPGTSLLAATLTSRGAARAMAARATFFYRGQSQSSQLAGSSV